MENICCQVPILFTSSDSGKCTCQIEEQGLPTCSRQCKKFLRQQVKQQRCGVSSDLNEEWSNVKDKMTLPHQPWFTVIPLGGLVRPDELKVKLNPRSRLLLVKASPRISRSGLRCTSTGSWNQKIHHIIALPKSIRMDEIQVKLTQKTGDLVVLAPYKQQFSTRRLSQEDLLKQTPYFQQQMQGTSEQWFNIPIKSKLTTSRNVFSYGNESETDSCSTTSSSSSSSSGTDSECDVEEFLKKRISKKSCGLQRLYGSSCNPSTRRSDVKKFIDLLQKIFSPNTVLCKIRPVQSTDEQSGCLQKQECQLVVDIQFVNWQPQNKLNVRLHETQPNVLIVEGQKITKDTLTGTTKAVKYVRREIIVPQWVNLQQLVYRLKEQGVLRIKLPCFISCRLTTKCSDSGLRCDGNPNWITGTCQQLKQQKTPFCLRKGHKKQLKQRQLL